MREKFPVPDFVPDRDSKLPKPPQESGITRRGILRGIVATGALGAFGALAKVSVIPGAATEKPAKAPEHDNVSDVAERQKSLDAHIAAIRRNLQDPDILQAREGAGREPLVTLLKALGGPISPRLLYGTSYDVSELHRKYPVQIKKTFGGDEYRLGNAVFWENAHDQLTAAHVVYGDESETVQYPLPRIDADIVHVKPGDEAPDPEQQVVHDDPTLTDNDIDCRFVVVVGNDTDQLIEPNAADGTGRKTYPGIAVRVTLGLANTFEGLDSMIGRFLFILPDGEARADTDALGNPVLTPHTKQKVAHAEGMSGAPMFVYRNGEYVFGGVFTTLEEIDISKDSSVDVGFIQGIDEIRRVERMSKRLG